MRDILDRDAFRVPELKGKRPMKISIICALAFVAAVPMPPAAMSAPPTFTPAADLQPGRIVDLLEQCRKLTIVAFRSNDSRLLDAYLDSLFLDQRANRDEIIACASYMIGVGDVGFYLPDPE